mmetsp:Transcript_52794/g.123477  ORF Transcript_52794/g.123477 Transcript_52794/m.123477 type:complete len:418 (+) Transcript_52794:55-1308(+)
MELEPELGVDFQHWQQLCHACDSKDGGAVDSLCFKVASLSRNDREKFWCHGAPCGTTWAAGFANATPGSLPAWQESLLNLLQTLTDFRPPLRDMDGRLDSRLLVPFLGRVVSHSAAQPKAAMWACRCIRNFGRSPDLRGPLSDTIPSLVAALSSEDKDVVAASAAALCNVSCTETNKRAAIEGNAVPALLQALSQEQRPLAADDIVACIGVMTTGSKEGASAVKQDGLCALLDALAMEHAVLATTTMSVLGGLAMALPSICTAIAENAMFLGRYLPQLLRSTSPDMREKALRLYLILSETDTVVDRAFAASGGELVLKDCLGMEVPIPAVPVCPIASSPLDLGNGFKRMNRPKRDPNVGRGSTAMHNLCQTFNPQCFDCFGSGTVGAGALSRAPQQVPSRQEMAEQALERCRIQTSE